LSFEINNFPRFNSIVVHLNHRNVTFVAISWVSLAKIEPFKMKNGMDFETRLVSAEPDGASLQVLVIALFSFVMAQSVVPR